MIDVRSNAGWAVFGAGSILDPQMNEINLRKVECLLSRHNFDNASVNVIEWPVSVSSLTVRLDSRGY